MGPDSFICIMICVVNTAFSVTPEQESSAVSESKNDPQKVWRRKYSQDPPNSSKDRLLDADSQVCVCGFLMCLKESFEEDLSHVIKTTGTRLCTGAGTCDGSCGTRTLSVIRQVLCRVASLLTVVSFERSAQLEEKTLKAIKAKFQSR